ncbi:unnamed protein product [Allacma fusca]|uniref:Uncharacterized protein n=1 Tax=Allacma fusca TaxID=39272 RepID=A0A8J2LLY3_9HEXA|nr:unnamed protein product [Allacma fusca]
MDGNHRNSQTIGKWSKDFQTTSYMSFQAGYTPVSMERLTKTFFHFQTHSRSDDLTGFGEDKPVLKKRRVGGSPLAHREIYRQRQLELRLNRNNNWTFIPPSETRDKSSQTLHQTLFELRQDMVRLEGKFLSFPDLPIPNSCPTPDSRRKRKHDSGATEPMTGNYTSNYSSKPTLSMRRGKKRKIQDVIDEDMKPEVALRKTIRPHRINFDFRIRPRNYYPVGADHSLMDWE